MMPVLFTIGSFNVYTFSFLLVFSFILSTFMVWKYGKDELKEEIYLDIYLYFCFIILVFARLVYILIHWSDFGTNILKYILVRETPGLSLWGGLLGGIIFLWWYCKKKKLEFYHFLDIFSVALCSNLIFIKIGEQLGGAGFGKETGTFLSVRIVGLLGKRHPAELYEAILYLILTILLIFLYNKAQRKRIPHGFTFYIFVLCLSFITFLLEFLKETTLYLGSLSIRQIITLVVLLFIIYPTYKRVKIIRMIKKEEHR